MAKWPFLVGIFILSGCGNTRKASPELKQKWSDEQLQRSITACSAGTNERNTPDLRVVKYCRCIYRFAAVRWTFDDYKNKVAEYETFLTKAVAPGCELRVLKGEE